MGFAKKKASKDLGSKMWPNPQTKKQASLVMVIYDCLQRLTSSIVHIKLLIPLMGNVDQWYQKLHMDNATPDVSLCKQ